MPRIPRRIISTNPPNSTTKHKKKITCLGDICDKKKTERKFKKKNPNSEKNRFPTNRHRLVPPNTREKIIGPGKLKFRRRNKEREWEEYLDGERDQADPMERRNERGIKQGREKGGGGERGGRGWGRRERERKSEEKGVLEGMMNARRAYH